MVSDDLEPEDLDFDDEEDFEDEEEEGFSSPRAPRPRARVDVYTVLLILSAIFYGIALAATCAEMQPYCTEFMWNLF